MRRAPDSPRPSVQDVRVDHGSAYVPVPQHMNQALAEEMVRRGWAWLFSTRLRGVTVLRMMVMNYDTRERHLHRLVADLERLARDPAVRRAAARSSG